MYIVVCISKDNKIEAKSCCENLERAKTVLHSLCYSHVGHIVNNISETESAIYKRSPGWVYGSYKELVCTIKIIPFQDIDPEARYSKVVNQIKEKSKVFPLGR